MTTLFVTGACGFIGSNLVMRMLRSAPFRIIAIDSLTYASSRIARETVLRHPRVHFLAADIGDAHAMFSAFDRFRPNAVLNLAAETHVDRSIDSALPFVATNVRGTVVLLEETWKYVRHLNGTTRADFRFLHVSTDEVYGSLGPTGSFREDTPYAPSSPYAASKASSDHFVRAFGMTYGLNTIITNCSNNYGPFQHPEKLIPLTILNALEARQLPIYGDGLNVRDWLHVDDHCTAILRVLERGRPGESYNVGASNEQTNLALIDRICEAVEQAVPAHSNPAMRRAGICSYHALKTFVADRPGHDRRYAIDSTKLREELGWEPAHDFREGLLETVKWYVDHQHAFVADKVGYDRERLGLG